MNLSLAHLPAEILGQILELQGLSPALVNLWKCGNRILNAKISSHVTEVDLKGLPFCSFAPPRLLFQLRSLYSLSLTCELDCAFFPEFMAQLPDTLVNLEIKRAVQSEAYQPPCSSKLSIDMHERFPLLETFFLEAPRGFKGGYGSILLPHTITHLSLHVFCLVYGEVEGAPESLLYMADLPRTLIQLSGTLEMQIYDLDDDYLYEDWSNAPPGLEQIDWIEFTQKVPIDFYWLPRQLKWVEWMTGHWGISRPEVLAESLPPTLASFSLSGMCCSYPDAGPLRGEFLGALPTTLRLLDLDIYDIGDVTPLPSALTQLKASLGDLFSALEDSWEDEKRRGVRATWLDYWPPHLTSLSCLISELTSTKVELLPRSLTFLDLTFWASVNFEFDGSLLPPNLVQLELQAQKKYIITGMLPRSLVELNFRDTTPTVRSPLPSSVTKVSTNTTLGLDLHEGILELYLAQCEFYELASLPRSLTALKINIMVMHQDSIDIFDTGSLFGPLPPGLRYLRVIGGGLPMSVALDPARPLRVVLPGLETLHLPHTKFPSEFLRELPSSLKVLDVGFSQISVEDAPLLRPNLELIGSRPITWHKPYLAPYWPLKSVTTAPLEAGFRAQVIKSIRALFH